MDRQVYFAKCGDRIKVGIATNVKKRLSNLRTGTAMPIELIAAVVGDHHLESKLHEQLQPYHVDGEWFRDCEEVRAVIDESVNGFDVGVDRKRPRKVCLFGSVAKLVWPNKTAAHIAALAGKDERSAWRWLSGENEPPACVLVALIVEITKPK